jgi:outer membrane protein assembly factor BamD (BamD/ComL family)
MSASGISASSFFDSGALSSFQQIQQEFQQLGQDLQSGNLTAAEGVFVTLQQDLPQGGDASSQSSNPIAQAFSQLGQDLQAGNLSGAQQDFATIQQDVQNQAQQDQAQQGQTTQGSDAGDWHHHHHHSDNSSSSESSEISQLMSQLGQDLQSGNLSGAQQTYTSLQQDFQQIGESVWAQSQSSSGSSTISVSA